MNVAQQTFNNTPGRALVLGLGHTGLAFTRWLRRQGESARVADTRAEPPGAAALDKDFELVLGEFETSLLNDVNRVLVSPGIPADNPLLEEARRRELPVYSDIDLFAAEANAPVIAVTGSNGKSTVVSMLAACLQSTGLKAAAGGNLGTPVLDMLTAETPNWYVLELSSFQLERTHALPCRAATLLNLSPDHLDWHGSLDKYHEAKLRIFDHADCWVVNRQAPELYWETSKPTISFGLDAPEPGHVGIIGIDGEAWLAVGVEPLLQVTKMSGSARHQQLNALAVMALLMAIGIDPATAADTLRTFKALPHRRENVRVLKGVNFIDDSKATNTGAALASIEAATAPVVLIAGGDSKGADLGDFATKALPKLKAAVLIGTAAKELEQLFGYAVPVATATDMVDAVEKACWFAAVGDQVLLAPACASTDQFADYKERGDAFRQAVEGLAS